jgi:hypothetical protein
MIIGAIESFGNPDMHFFIVKFLVLLSFLQTHTRIRSFIWYNDTAKPYQLLS